VLPSGCHCHIFSCRATAIYTYPADLRLLVAGTPGLLHSSPTFQEPSPVDIIASYTLLWCLSQNRQPSLNKLWRLNLNRPPCSLLPLRCWAVVAAQHPIPSYWSVLCHSPARPGTIINTRPRCLRPRGNVRLVCYYYYQFSLAMTAPLWQRPPRVTLLLSMLARDVCTLVATTASRAIIINARPSDYALVANIPLACPFYHQRLPGITAP